MKSGLMLHTARFLVILLSLGGFASDTVYGLVERGGDEVYVSEKINDDLLLGGSDIKFDGELLGEVLAAGMDIVIDGTIDGNVNAAGYTLKVGGQVSRSVRIAGYKTTADGTIGNNLMMAGAIARISSTCEVQNDAYITASFIHINGTVLGDLNAEGDEVTITGVVDRDVKIIAGSKLKIERTAVITGNIEYSSPNKADIADDAQIDGDVKWKRVSKDRDDPLKSLLIELIFLVASFITGLFIIWLCRNQCCSVKDIIATQAGKSLGIGLIALIVTPILIIFSLVTVIGIPVAIIGLFLFLIVFYVSKLFVAIYIGERIIKLISTRGMESQALALLIGLILLALLNQIPYVGSIIYIVAVMIGTGAMLVSFARYRRAVFANKSATATVTTKDS